MKLLKSLYSTDFEYLILHLIFNTIPYKLPVSDIAVFRILLRNCTAVFLLGLVFLPVCEVSDIQDSLIQAACFKPWILCNALVLK